MKRLHAIVTGRVQGVGYRAAVQKRIIFLNVTGYIKNLRNGTVEIVAEGEQTVLQEVLEIAYDGSFWGNVDHIETNYCEATGEFKDFSIAH
jgi:acylphosphatase